jgi:hypothetical protein
MNLPEKVYTEKEVTRARTTAKAVGWLQGGGVVLGGAILLNLLGWIPVVVGLIAVAWMLFKLMSGPKSEEGE